MVEKPTNESRNTKRCYVEMPNHITQYLTIDAPPKHHKTIVKLLRSKNNGDIDFNRIVRQPLPIALTVSGSTDSIITCKKNFKCGISKKAHNDYLNAPECRIETPITDKMRDKYYEKYGAINWYDWNIKHWGTKWNAYDTELLGIEDRHISYCFNTAWSIPSAYYDQLRKELKKISSSCKFHVKWRDEAFDEDDWRDEYYD